MTLYSFAGSQEVKKVKTLHLNNCLHLIWTGEGRVTGAFACTVTIPDFIWNYKRMMEEHLDHEGLNEN